MLVYRIGHKNHIGSLSPSGVEGRWASAGRMVIYCSESIPLAFLENMVRRQGVGFNSDFKISVIEVPDNLTIETIVADRLRNGWKSTTDFSICQAHGNKWYDAMKKPVLKVPSVILQEVNNYVLNTKHKDFEKIRIIGTTDLVPDDRIEDILKRYRKP